LAYAVVGGKKSSIVVGKYDNSRELIQSTDHGGVGGKHPFHVLKKREGGKYRHDAFWIITVTEADYNAAVIDIVKFQEICTKWGFNETKKCYLAHVVVGGKKSSIVVGKYNSQFKLRQSTVHGGFGGNNTEVLDVLIEGPHGTQLVINK